MNLTSSLELLKENVVVNEAKLDDVFSLLKNRFGADWRNDEKLSYFKKIFKANYKPSGKQQDEKVDENFEESDSCSCCGEDEETFFL